uniref:Uncharacterized protein n=1 Tax=Rhizophora mucronata TaxID=61149 RepID=A0A2P2M036_RHIMU
MTKSNSFNLLFLTCEYCKNPSQPQDGTKILTKLFNLLSPSKPYSVYKHCRLFAS